jgi:hypothetical protein
MSSDRKSEKLLVRLPSVEVPTWLIAEAFADVTSEGDEMDPDTENSPFGYSGGYI